jgi:cell division cycle 20, cofactor of APC complex
MVLAVGSQCGRERTTTVFETPGPSNGRKRQLHTPGSVQNFRSHKKRRMSMASVDVSSENPFGQRKTLFSSESATASTSSVSFIMHYIRSRDVTCYPQLQTDRFIAVRPESVVPLTISPRTNRMYKTFGMLGTNRLSFKDENQPPSSSSASVSKTGGKENSAFDLLRKSASTLVKKSKHVNESSVAQNLALNPRSFMALDSPALSNSVYSCPISWSSHNLIAVACGPEVYFQNLDTRKVSRFFRAGDASMPPIRGAAVREVTHISWGSGQHSNYLAAANDASFLEVYDAEKGPFLNSVLSLDQNLDNPLGSISCLSWNDHQLTWADHKDVYVLDVRTKPDTKRRLHGDSTSSRHGTSIASMAWNNQGNQLATGDIDGVVHIWDIRAQKMLTERGKLGRMKHGGPVKVRLACLRPRSSC